MSEYSDFVSQYMRKAKPKSLAEGRKAMQAAAAEWRAQKRRKNPQFYTDESGVVHPMRKTYSRARVWGGKYSEVQRAYSQLRKGPQFRRDNPLYAEEACPACGTPLLVPAGIGNFTCPGCRCPLRQV